MQEAQVATLEAMEARNTADQATGESTWDNRPHYFSPTVYTQIFSVIVEDFVAP
jgi:hypothetical protein